MKYAVETISLTKVFSDWWGRRKVNAVDNLNLKIRTNEVFGLLGPNGSGKTTAIKMMLGLLYPTKGHSIVLGGDSTDPKINEHIGFLPEESYLYQYLNARETLDFYAKLFKLPSKIRKDRIEALLDMVGLKAVANRPVGMFSKGMARRIGLAQALINDPDLLILDEPTTGLDPIGTRQIKDLIIQLAKRGKTIILCSHLLADVEDVCDRISILYGGKIQAMGKVEELLKHTDKKQITTSNSISDEALAKIRNIIEAEGADCDIVSPMDKLESFFIRTVADAQKQSKFTSGAVSTTNIGNFLTSGDTSKGILDKLVSESVGEETIGKKIETRKAEPIEIVEPDKDLLSALTQTSEPVKPTAVIKTDTVEPTEVPGAVDDDILDELVGKKRPVETEIPKKTDVSEDQADG
ncbi:MAG: ABC transporter ATP-binding protein [Planctomycetes bacterium]|nr:ABC transporter ATP-binding protein [Planctomycetota bacterium]